MPKDPRYPESRTSGLKKGGRVSSGNVSTNVRYTVPGKDEAEEVAAFLASIPNRGAAKRVGGLLLAVARLERTAKGSDSEAAERARLVLAGLEAG